jgi:hypothetical protein
MYDSSLDVTTHELKCWPEFFDAVARGVKTFELRKNDRGYQAGDRLVLRKWDPNHRLGGCYIKESGHEAAHACEAAMLTLRVTYVLSGFGLEPGYVAIGFHRIEPSLHSQKRGDS